MRPLARGYIHRIAFFVACGASALLLKHSHGALELTANSIYCLSLIGMFAVSALYHSRYWSRPHYLLIRRIDHAAIFILIAGTATPICLLGLNESLGLRLILMMWAVAAIGIPLTVFSTHSPKWLRALFYVALGWLAFPFLHDIEIALGPSNLWLLIIGGIFYTVGALLYALKWPNPFPRHFGYHEIFHAFVVIASGCHFKVIYTLTK